MQNLEIWKSSHNTINADESNGDSTLEISFLVNGCDVSSISASTYIAVLPFAYFPSLHAVALEFPLDVSLNGDLIHLSRFFCLKFENQTEFFNHLFILNS